MNRSILVGMLGLLVCSSSVLACSDDSCYPSWNLKRDMLDTCNNIPFLSPANDSRVNLRLFWSDLTQQPLQSDSDVYYANQGYAQVPFPNDRVTLNPQTEQTTSDNPQIKSLEQQAKDLQVSPELLPVISQIPDWSGSRCVSNNARSAEQFLSQIQASALTATEKQKLADTRIQMLQNCDPELLQQANWQLSEIQSTEGKEFADYLNAAIAFYSGDFQTATQLFQVLANSTQPWLKETARYMSARTLLNAAQQNAFDEMGYPANENADKTQLNAAKSAFENYINDYPQGQYLASAAGLIRRVDWLAGDNQKLAQDYASLFHQASNITPAIGDALIQEIDNKLLMTMENMSQIDDPTLLATIDLMYMRHRYEDERNPFTEAELLNQADKFKDQPELFQYLKAAYAFYVEKDADKTLSLLETLIPNQDAKPTNYLQFSEISLKGFALENKENYSDAATIWKSLLEHSNEPLQRQQAELALAMNYERTQQIHAVFASGSPIRNSMIRQILLRNIADAKLLRQQIRIPISNSEREVALFTLLYKDLMRGHYSDFLSDLKSMPEKPSSTPLYMGYAYPQQTLSLFQWSGENTGEYQCPALIDVVTTLQSEPNNAKGLNCLGDFVLRNGLDNFPLNEQPDANDLGGTQTLFNGSTFSRLEAYQQVIADKKASHQEQAYALFRSINCFARSGINNCDTQDIPLDQRKQWFQTLKSRYADTSWGQSLKYYW